MPTYGLVSTVYIIAYKNESDNLDTKQHLGNTSTSKQEEISQIYY